VQIIQFTVFLMGPVVARPADRLCQTFHAVNGVWMVRSQGIRRQDLLRKEKRRWRRRVELLSVLAVPLVGDWVVDFRIGLLEVWKIKEMLR